MQNIQIVIFTESFIINRGLQLIFNKLRGINVLVASDDWHDIETIINTNELDLILVSNYQFEHDISANTFYKTNKTMRWALVQTNKKELNKLYNFEFNLKLQDKEETILKILSNFIEHDKNNTITSSSESTLSKREKDILKEVALGLTNHEIAEKLFISQHTVIAHRKKITSKLGIKTISGLTVYALLNELIEMGDVDQLK